MPFRICDLIISSSALGPWPCPREIISKWSVLPRNSFAKRSKELVGSEPYKWMHINKVVSKGKYNSKIKLTKTLSNTQ